MNNINCYIMSVEGSEVYEHMYRDKEIHKNYVGMLPYSLKKMKLEKLGMKTFDSKKYNKTMTNDIINIKFNQKVKSSEQIISLLNKNTNNDNKEKIEKYIKELKTKNDWKEIKIDDVINKETNEIVKGLRTQLYEEGFTIKDVDKKTGEITETKYVVFARSSAKSRTSQVLFIKEKLHDKMIKWMRLGMNLDNCDDIDYPSLLSYESLVGSSLEDLIKINVKNILIVSDVKSLFNIDCNVVAKNNDELLESNLVKDYEMQSDLFDGEGLLDSQYFTDGKGFKLLRQHMFKCAAFNSNIQLFLKEYAQEHNIDFETWEIFNMFNEPMLAKEVHCIITPNSLKALKFSNKKGSKPKMWEHWKKVIEKEDNIFGVCKSEKPSKRGFDEQGNILNQSSYQMLNSMPYNFSDIEQLSQFEVNYIEQLKNNDNTYVERLQKESNKMNCNEMLADLYKHNPKIININLFKNKRKKDIHNYITYVKKGKVRLNGDYCTIMQNGKEFLYHAIGLLPINKKNVLDYKVWENEMILNENEVYTTLHEFDREFVGFRNPHTSPSNVLIVKNKDSEFIKRYFNLTDNIIYTSAINFPINRILSGQDVDSDNMIIFDNQQMLNTARLCYIKSPTSNYKVCENGVRQELNKYKVCNTDMAKIDNILSQSQKNIGRVVNLGQLYMSTYWDCINNGETDTNKLNELLQGVDICTILSEISIDMAKRLYDVDIKKQIKHLSKCKYLYTYKDNKGKTIKVAPNFFKYVSKNENIKMRMREYKTPMDHLYKILNNIEDAEDTKTIDIETLLKDIDTKKVKSRQVDGIIKAINHMSNNIKYIEASMQGEEEYEKKERYTALDNIRNEHMQLISRYKIKTKTVSAIINKVFNGKIECKYKTDLLNTLYKTDREEFLGAFKN